MKNLLACMLALAGAAAALAQAPAAEPRRIPLHEQQGWQVLQYSNLPPHRVSFSPEGLRMAVEASAMPVIHPLKTPVRVAAVRVQGRVDGQLKLPAQRQGEPKFDDYVFRLGLVERGERKLNFVQRQVAPSWIRTLFALAPEGGGIARIQFLNVGADSAAIGRERRHPLSELIFERVVAVPRPDGRFDFEHRLERPLDTVAVWLSSDGDDSGSSFTVLVERIELIER
jgi:hypothetical protein